MNSASTCHPFRARKSQLRSMVADFPRIAACCCSHWPIVGVQLLIRLPLLLPTSRSRAHHPHSCGCPARRMLAIGCGYPDGNDFDRLRFDPAFKLACGRLPDTGGDLCSQPTISRWENAPTLREIIRLTYAWSISGAGVTRSHPVCCSGRRRHGRCCARPPAIGAMERPL